MKKSQSEVIKKLRNDLNTATRIINDDIKKISELRAQVMALTVANLAK